MFSSNKLRAITVLILPVLFGFGPCGPIAGGELEGALVAEKVNDFQFVQNQEHCAIEVKNEEAHSVNVNCWTVGKQLFIGCKDCEGKTWSSAIVDNPKARIRIGEQLYPVRATKMADSGAIERAWKFRWEKYEEGEPEPVPQGYWLFHLGSSPQA